MFEALALPWNLAIFALGAAVIWWAGTRLERLTDAIAISTGMGGALSGLLLLAVATSLPEVATTVTALLAGNPELAVHNLLGGVAFQVVVLVIADLVRGRGPLTRFAPSFGLLIGGVGVLAMLAVAIAALALGAQGQFGVAIGPAQIGLNPIALSLPLIFLGILFFTRRVQGAPRWRPVGTQPAPPKSDTEEIEGRHRGRSLRHLGWLFTAFALLVTAGGWAAATTADVMAEQTGLGSGFIGATLLAAATSLPEISTTTAAVRNRNEDVAVSNVFGSNSFDTMLLALVTLMSVNAMPEEPPVSAIFTAALGILLTCVYMLGLLERSDRAVARLGIDSIAVVALYLAGIGTLYTLT